MGNCVPTSNHPNCDVIPFEGLRNHANSGHICSEKHNSHLELAQDEKPDDCFKNKNDLLCNNRAIIEKYSCSFSHIIFEEVFKTFEFRRIRKKQLNFGACDENSIEMNSLDVKETDGNLSPEQTEISDLNRDIFGHSISEDGAAIMAVDYELELIPSPAWQTRTCCVMPGIAVSFFHDYSFFRRTPSATLLE